jgi:hypothetical protein
MGTLVLLAPTLLALASSHEGSSNVDVLWTETTLFLGLPFGTAFMAIGTGLLRRSEWARSAAMVLPVCYLLVWPLLLFGAYSFWVLTRGEAIEAFAGGFAKSAPNTTASGRTPEPGNEGLNDLLCLMTATIAGGALAALCAWVGSLRGGGGDFFGFLIIPPMMLLWALGGPLALLFGLRGRAEARSTSSGEARWALRLGLVLSFLVTVSPAAVIARVAFNGPFW